MHSSMPTLVTPTPASSPNPSPSQSRECSAARAPPIPFNLTPSTAVTSHPQSSHSIYPTTTPAYIRNLNSTAQRGRTRYSSHDEHPVVIFMADHAAHLDSGSMQHRPFSWYHTYDFTLTLPNGAECEPGAESWTALLERYAPFSAHYHELQRVWVNRPVEADDEDCDGSSMVDEWEMCGLAQMYANYSTQNKNKAEGDAAGDMETHQDLQGRNWEAKVPGMFIARVVKDQNGPKGFKMKSLQLFGDGLPVLNGMLDRGIITADEIR